MLHCCKYSFSSLFLLQLLLWKGLVKFFGSLAIMDSPQQVCEKYPVFLEVVFSMAMNLDPTLTPVALDTLGVLGNTVEGKQVLQKTGSCVFVNAFAQQTVQKERCLCFRSAFNKTCSFSKVMAFSNIQYSTTSVV